MNYYAFHIGDYVSKTRHLTWDEDMAYRRLIDVYYTQEGPLPADERQVMRLVMATSEAQREAVKTILAEFFELTGDGYRQHRCDEEIAHANAKREKARASAAHRWEKQDALPAEENDNAKAMRTHSEGNAPNPNPNPNPIKEKEPAQAREPDRFEEFLTAYPNRVAKGAARKAWKPAIVKTSPDTIIAAARAFAAKQVGQDKKFIPHPASWLNAERWADENLAVQVNRLMPPMPVVFVPEDSPAFKAWAVYRGQSPPAVETRIDGRIVKGWRFPTEYPPPREAAA